MFVVLVGLALPSSVLAQGKLERAREQIRGDQHDDDGGGREPHDHAYDRGDDRHHDHDYGGHWHRHHDDCDDDDEPSLLELLLNALFDGSSDEPDAPSPAYGYARYPYASGHPGYLISRRVELALRTSAADDPGALAGLGRAARPWAAQLALEGGYLDGLARGGPAFRLLTPSRLELDSRMAWLHETLSGTDADATDGADDAWLGATHLSYRLAERSQGMLRLGVGARYFIDAGGADGGLDLLLGTDWFPIRPLVLSLELSGGSLGDTFAFAARAELGVQLGRVELYASYEQLVIGETQLPEPLLGTRIWF